MQKLLVQNKGWHDEALDSLAENLTNELSRQGHTVKVDYAQCLIDAPSDISEYVAMFIHPHNILGDNACCQVVVQAAVKLHIPLYLGIPANNAEDYRWFEKAGAHLFRYDIFNHTETFARLAMQHLAPQK